MSKKASASARKLVFEGKIGNNRFEAIWDAFRLTYPTEAKGYDKLKVCNALGKKLKSVSDLTPKDRDEYGRTIKEGDGQVLALSEELYDLLVKMTSSEAVQWSFLKGDNAEEAIAWLRTIKQVDLSEDGDKSEKKVPEKVSAGSEAPNAAS